MSCVDLERTLGKIEISDFKSDLHFHLARHGDGVGGLSGSHDSEIEEDVFIAWAKRFLPGLEYFVAADHIEHFGRNPDRFREEKGSGFEYYYNDIELIRPQLARIGGLNERCLGIQAVAGLEASIQMGGEVNASDEILDLFDLVIASDHYFEAAGEPAVLTDRYLTALSNPRVDILGHPGRLYSRWEQLGWEAIARTALDGDKAIEINMTPVAKYGLKEAKPEPSRRVDVMKILAESGVKVSIGGDVHKFLPLRQDKPLLFRQLYEIKKLMTDLNSLGFQKSQVLNVLSADELVQWAKGNNSP